MIARESFPLSSIFWSVEQRKSIRVSLIFRKEEKTRMCEKRTVARRRKERRVKERNIVLVCTA